VIEPCPIAKSLIHHVKRQKSTFCAICAVYAQFCSLAINEMWDRQTAQCIGVCGQRHCWPTTCRREYTNCRTPTYTEMEPNIPILQQQASSHSIKMFFTTPTTLRIHGVYLEIIQIVELWSSVQNRYISKYAPNHASLHIATYALAPLASDIFADLEEHHIFHYSYRVNAFFNSA